MADDWQPQHTAPLGVKVRVAHSGDPYSFKDAPLTTTYGTRTEDGWELTSFFLVPIGNSILAANRPTHWLAAQAQPAIALAESAQ